MFENDIALAMTLRSNRGAYAVLLGSGVSRSAGIPTGWEVILELIRKIAAVKKAQLKDDPESWYRSTYGKEPNYSDIINELAKTSSERRALLQGFFEPSEDEKRSGLKQPTPAHRAIAALVARGYIRIIITTNFDRLMEQALAEVGITAQVIASPDAVEGCTPLAHSPCTIVKVHGDYLDIRIKNTPDELETYDPRIGKLLDQIFDEYGLIIAGWSAAWDPALRNALNRSASRRYSVYWGKRGDLTAEASALVLSRGIQVLDIIGSDEFFEELNEKVRALEDSETPHSLSVSFSVAMLKRLLPDASARIRLHDFVTHECNRVLSRLKSSDFSVQSGFSAEALNERVTAYDSAMATIEAMFAHGFFWDQGHSPLWKRCISRIGEVEITGGTTVWIKLKQYPALLLYYAAGLGSVLAGNYRQLASITSGVKLQNGRGQVESFPEVISTATILETNVAKLLPGCKDRKLPLSHFLFDRCRKNFTDLIKEDSEYEAVFDRFEYLSGLLYAYMSNSDWGPIGEYVFRNGFAEKTAVAQQTDQELEDQGARWPPVADGLFPDLEKLKKIKASFDVHVEKCAQQLRW